MKGLTQIEKDILLTLVDKIIGEYTLRQCANQPKADGDSDELIEGLESIKEKITD